MLMSFWSDLGEVALKGFAAAGSMIKVLEWEKHRNFKDMVDAVSGWVHSTSEDQIKMTFTGFEHRLVQIRDHKEMGKLLSIYEVFCIEAYKRRMVSRR
jgi:hypothetical protein